MSFHRPTVSYIPNIHKHLPAEARDQILKLVPEYIKLFTETDFTKIHEETLYAKLGHFYILLFYKAIPKNTFDFSEMINKLVDLIKISKRLSRPYFVKFLVAIIKGKYISKGYKFPIRKYLANTQRFFYTGSRKNFNQCEYRDVLRPYLREFIDYNDFEFLVDYFTSRSYVCKCFFSIVPVKSFESIKDLIVIKSTSYFNKFLEPIYFYLLQNGYYEDIKDECLNKIEYISCSSFILALFITGEEKFYNFALKHSNTKYICSNVAMVHKKMNNLHNCPLMRRYVKNLLEIKARDIFLSHQKTKSIRDVFLLYPDIGTEIFTPVINLMFTDPQSCILEKRNLGFVASCMIDNGYDPLRLLSTTYDYLESNEILGPVSSYVNDFFIFLSASAHKYGCSPNSDDERSRISFNLFKHFIKNYSDKSLRPSVRCSYYSKIDVEQVLVFKDEIKAHFHDENGVHYDEALLTHIVMESEILSKEVLPKFIENFISESDENYVKKYYMPIGEIIFSFLSGKSHLKPYVDRLLDLLRNYRETDLSKLEMLFVFALSICHTRSVRPDLKREKFYENYDPNSSFSLLELHSENYGYFISVIDGVIDQIIDNIDFKSSFILKEMTVLGLVSHYFMNRTVAPLSRLKMDKIIDFISKNHMEIAAKHSVFKFVVENVDPLTAKMERRLEFYGATNNDFTMYLTFQYRTILKCTYITVERINEIKNYYAELIKKSYILYLPLDPMEMLSAFNGVKLSQEEVTNIIRTLSCNVFNATNPKVMVDLPLYFTTECLGVHHNMFKDPSRVMRLVNSDKVISYIHTEFPSEYMSIVSSNILSIQVFYQMFMSCEIPPEEMLRSIMKSDEYDLITELPFDFIISLNYKGVPYDPRRNMCILSTSRVFGTPKTQLVVDSPVSVPSYVAKVLRETLNPETIKRLFLSTNPFVPLIPFVPDVFELFKKEMLDMAIVEFKREAEIASIYFHMILESIPLLPDPYVHKDFMSDLLIKLVNASFSRKLYIHSLTMTALPYLFDLLDEAMSTTKNTVAKGNIIHIALRALASSSFDSFITVLSKVIDYAEKVDINNLSKEITVNLVNTILSLRLNVTLKNHDTLLKRIMKILVNLSPYIKSLINTKKISIEFSKELYDNYVQICESFQDLPTNEKVYASDFLKNISSYLAVFSDFIKLETETAIRFKLGVPLSKDSIARIIFLHKMTYEDVIKILSEYEACSFIERFMNEISGVYTSLYSYCIPTKMVDLGNRVSFLTQKLKERDSVVINEVLSILNHAAFICDDDIVEGFPNFLCQCSDWVNFKLKYHGKVRDSYNMFFLHHQIGLSKIEEYRYAVSNPVYA